MNFSTIAMCGSYLANIITLVILLVKPIRERWLGTKAIQDGQKCLLRSDILSTYYKHAEEETIRQYESENLEMEYAAYKALGGNSFIDQIHEKVQDWKVQS